MSLKGRPGENPMAAYFIQPSWVHKDATGIWTKNGRATPANIGPVRGHFDGVGFYTNVAESGVYLPYDLTDMRTGDGGDGGGQAGNALDRIMNADPTIKSDLRTASELTPIQNVKPTDDHIRLAIVPYAFFPGRTHGDGFMHEEAGIAGMATKTTVSLGKTSIDVPAGLITVVGAARSGKTTLARNLEKWNPKMFYELTCEPEADSLPYGPFSLVSAINNSATVGAGIQGPKTEGQFAFIDSLRYIADSSASGPAARGGVPRSILSYLSRLDSFYKMNGVVVFANLNLMLGTEDSSAFAEVITGVCQGVMLTMGVSQHGVKTSISIRGVNDRKPMNVRVG